MMLYEALIASKLGFAAAPDMYTGLLASKMPFKKETISSMSGVPPLSFRANGEPLIECLIYGATGGVGDRTANLFDKSNPDVYQNTTIVASEGTWRKYAGPGKVFRFPCEPNANYAISIDSSIATSIFRIMLIAVEDVPEVNVDVPGTLVVNTSMISSYSFSTLSNSKYIIFQVASDVYENAFETLMLNKGSTPLAYEPYGFKVPIICGNTTTNIYLDSPLDIRETISMADTGIQIPTIRGSNTLTVGTTVQPSVYIKYRR